MGVKNEKLFKTILTMAVTGVVFLSLVGMNITRFGQNARPSSADAVIVLGCRLYGTVPSPFLQARLDEGLRLYQAGYGQYIIVSGGQGPGEDIPEAEAMRQYLIARGVEPKKIITEDQSTSTMENILFSKDKMEAYGLKDAVIVSNKYHLKRTSLMAQSVGLNATYSGVYLTQYRAYEMAGFIREIAALVKFYLLKR
ncbi:YdcF family protein [Zhaonella formicivorans]|jgi:uncharacterized SAM-binding protein YcdF (DUF218 family)|uniref:YdcF family protein n=1 Tax=Zhaonella formicivorans TaxID=2528593 RepID=UPI001D118DA0|nr:YdcF family protein [Zhaonella formicivorans]